VDSSRRQSCHTWDFAAQRSLPRNKEDRLGVFFVEGVANEPDEKANADEEQDSEDNQEKEGLSQIPRGGEDFLQDRNQGDEGQKNQQKVECDLY